MRARLLSLGITLFWVCMMCTLVVQRILPEHRRAKSLLIEPDVLASQWSDIREWSWIRRNDQTMGAVALEVTQRQTPEGTRAAGYTAAESGEIEVPILFLPQRVQFQLTVELTREFNVSKFAASVRLWPALIELSGFVLERQLFYRVAATQAEPFYGALPLERPLSLLAAVRPMIARQFALVVGRSYPVDVVDPVNNVSHGQARVTVAAREAIQLNGKTLVAYRLDTTFAGVTRHSWVSKEGVTLRRELFKGYVMEQGSRGEILRRFPALARPLRVPPFDVTVFMENATRQGAAAPRLSPNALSIVGQLLGGE